VDQEGDRKYRYIVGEGVRNDDVYFLLYRWVEPSDLPGFDYVWVVDAPYSGPESAHHNRRVYRRVMRTEDRIEKKLIDSETVFIGHLLGSRSNRLIFRSRRPGPDFVEVTAGLFRKEKFDVVSRLDADWSWHMEAFRFDPREAAARRNAMLHKQLAEAGDDATIPRNVDFCFFFESADSRQRGLDRLVELGYRLGEQGMWEAEGSFGLVVSFLTTVGPPEMAERCAALVELAEEMGAEFDGWETEVRTG